MDTFELVDLKIITSPELVPSAQKVLHSQMLEEQSTKTFCVDS